MRKKSGFTLIEMLVALGLCAILLFSLISILNFTLTLMEKQQDKSLDQSAGLIVLSQITKDIRNSQNLFIDINNNSLHLTLNSQETIYVYQNNKIAKIRAKSTQYLSEEYQIDQLNFNRNNNLIIIELGQLMLGIFKKD